MENYQIYTLSNRLRIVHLPNNSQISYCGVIVNTGSRDENDGRHGMAHFIEHMLFKGTTKRKSSQIINRLEDVGGELNAYTTKEETVVYAGFLKEYTERAIELIADLVQHATFPQQELEKERVIVQDEIQSYNDSPSELIYDEFEELLFDSNPMAHNVLGTKEHLDTFTSQNTREFYGKHYLPHEMVFFSLGNIDFQRIIKWCEKYFSSPENMIYENLRVTPSNSLPVFKEMKKDTYQVHCLMGTRAYDMNHPDRIVLNFLNNILGGPGMNSLLNLSLRERNGLVYNVESSYQIFTDCGWWGVYFGTDPENYAKCEHLVRNELKRLCNEKIKETKLKKYKLQLMGQLAIASENKENQALALGKSFLRYGKYDDMEEIRRKINEITSEQIQQVANEIFDVNKLNVLKYY